MADTLYFIKNDITFIKIRVIKLLIYLLFYIN